MRRHILNISLVGGANQALIRSGFDKTLGWGVQLPKLSVPRIIPNV